MFSAHARVGGVLARDYSRDTCSVLPVQKNIYLNSGNRRKCIGGCQKMAGVLKIL